MDKTKAFLENTYKKSKTLPPKTDDWLEKYKLLIEESRDTPIIELGCGSGNDTWYLAQRGYKVLSCDYSQTALSRLYNFISTPECVCMDMREKFPFESGSAKVIISDLSIHYFDEDTTRAIILEIKRVLMQDGIVICRVNSVQELHNEKETPQKIAHNYYRVGAKEKRYFNKEAVEEFFRDFELRSVLSYDMLRYEKPKSVLEFYAKKK